MKPVKCSADSPAATPLGRRFFLSGNVTAEQGATNPRTKDEYGARTFDFDRD